MKRVAMGLALALAASTAFAGHANTINKTGFAGVNKTQSAQSLGHSKLVFTALGDFASSNDMFKTGDATQPYAMNNSFNRQQAAKQKIAADTTALFHSALTGQAKDIVLRVEPRQAKYFRALPLHPSQQEVVHDNYSIFTYRMFNTYDLRQAILSYGSNVEVLQPPELRTMIREELQHSLDAYR